MRGHRSLGHLAVQKMPFLPVAIQTLLTARSPLPAFIIAGATRCGSSTLHQMLGTHPDIAMSKPKELWFFNTDSRYSRGAPYYKSFFRKTESLIGESTPYYLNKGVLFRTRDRRSAYFSETDSALKRIADMLPEARIIISLRAPLARIESNFFKNARQGKEINSVLNIKLQMIWPNLMRRSMAISFMGTVIKFIFKKFLLIFPKIG